MKNNILVIAAISLILGSCSSLLEEEPESFLSPDIYTTSEDNIELAVNGIYDALGNRGFGVGLNFGNYNQGLLLLGNFGTDQFRTSSTDVNHRFFLHDYFNWEPSSEVVTNVWTVHYIGINSANTMISNVEPLVGNSDLDDDRLNSMLGEAKFLRALFYFNLVRFFGDVPLKLSETASLTADDVVGIERSPVIDIYNQIEEDLLFAEEHLGMPSELADQDHGRATKTAAQAFLARFYSTWATYPLKDASKWTLAADYAEMVMQSGQHSLMDNFEDVFTLANEGNDELIFVVKNSYVLGENTSSGATNGVLTNGFNGFTSGAQAGFGQIRAEQVFYSSFDPTDTRRNWTISDFIELADLSTLHISDTTGGVFEEGEIDNPDSNWFGFAKFRRDGTWTGFDSPYDYPLYRYADVLLMYAEATANAAGGPTAASYAAINEVRERAFGAPNDLTAGMSLNDFNQAILDERSWELAGEDCSRWHDLIRWEQFEEVVNDRKRQAVKDLYDSQVHRLFPIPTTEIDVNPLINQADQNTGY